MRITIAALLLASVVSSAAAQTKPEEKSSAGRELNSDEKGQTQPQGTTGPLETKSGGAPASSPQGETPPGMQSAPGGSSKTSVEPQK
jgi:hypothetical protein